VAHEGGAAASARDAARCVLRECSLGATRMTFDDLFKRASAALHPRKLSGYADAGGVAAAILAADGNVYVGVCIDTACSMGFCAEHAAAASMITQGQNRVFKMIAIGSEGNIMPPCGRCREFIYQVHEENGAAEVMVRPGVVVTLKDLLPFR
jgi:cytidine deaminase